MTHDDMVRGDPVNAAISGEPTAMAPGMVDLAARDPWTKTAVQEPQKQERPQFVKVRLSVPIPVMGEMIKELTLRRPTGLDLMEIGMPVVFDQSGAMVHNYSIVGAMINRLGSIPPGSVQKMDSQDMVKAALKMTGFFMPAAEDSETNQS